MKTKLITTIIISLLVASSPICLANPASSLIKIGGKIIKGSSKVAKEAKVIKPSPTLPRVKTPPSTSPGFPYGPVIINAERNINNRRNNSREETGT